MKTCTVVHATPEAQRSCALELHDSATVADALARARELWSDADVPWDGEVGIFGEPCSRDAVPLDGDRIEIYRPLKLDPKESRRDRVQRARREARDRAAAVPRKPRA